MGWPTVSLSSPVPIHQAACKVTANYNTNNFQPAPGCAAHVLHPVKENVTLAWWYFWKQYLYSPPFVFPRHVSVLKHLQEVRITSSIKTFAVRDVLCRAPSSWCRPIPCVSQSVSPSSPPPTSCGAMLRFISVVAAPSTSWFWQSWYLCSGMVLCELTASRRSPYQPLLVYL